MPDDEKYRDDEVRAILDRALRKQSGAAVSHEELVAIGAEVGLSRESVEAAALEVRETREAEQASARIIDRRRAWLFRHAFVFAAVHAVLFAVNFLTSPGDWWVLLPLFSWGLVLVLHAGFGLSRHISERTLQRDKDWQAKRRARIALPERESATISETKRARVGVSPPTDATSPDEAFEREAMRDSRKR